MAIDRRDFLKTTGKAISVGAATLALGGRVLGANDRVRVAICGVRGRGNDHIHGYSRVPGTEIAALCDVDESVLNQRLGEIAATGVAKAKALRGHPQAAGGQRYRRHFHRHSQSLALADGDLGLPGRQRCFRGKALLA